MTSGKHAHVISHRNKLGNTFSSSEKFEKIHFPFFSGDTEIFITYISYLGLATGQFMEIHDISCATEDTICHI